MTGLEQYLADVASEAGADAAVDAEYRHAGRLFAAVSGNAAEFRLDPEIADAALGTPATSTSSRGADWVRLTVDEDSPHDLDRARAWFLSAWRNAG